MDTTNLTYQKNPVAVSSLPLELPLPHFPFPPLLITIPVFGDILIFNPSILPDFPRRSFTHHTLCSLELVCGYA